MTASRPARGLAGETRVPGDKSVSHRALILGGLAVGATEIEGLLEGADVLRTAAAMTALGAVAERLGPGRWNVTGRGIGGLVSPDDVLDMGNSGTAARLLCGVLASHDVFAVLTGDASLRRRPMRRVTEPLTACGARFVGKPDGGLPLAVQGAADPLPIEHRMNVASAQVKSAILLAGLAAPGLTRVEEPAPTRDHTETMLRHFGAEVRVEPAGAGVMVTLVGQPELGGARVRVPGDPSSAAFPIVAALLVPGSDLRIGGVMLNPLRTGLFATLREMGASLTVENERLEGSERVGDLVARGSGLRCADVPASRAPSMIDEYPILAVAAAFAEGATRLRGLGELRVKESDRLAATAAMLAGNGVAVSIEGDDLIVEGRGAVPGGGVVATGMDHRLAMSALVMGLASERPVIADDTAFIETSFPDFAGLMAGLGASLAPA